MKYIIIRSIYQPTRTHRNVIQNCNSCTLYVIRQTSNFEDRFFISGRCHNVRISCLLYVFYRSSLRANNKTNYAIRNSNFYSCRPWCVGRWRARCQRVQSVVFPLRSYLREMFSGGDYLSFGQSYIFFSPGYDKNRLFTTHRCLDISVGLSSQSLNFAAWKEATKTCTSETRGLQSQLLQTNSITIFLRRNPRKLTLATYNFCYVFRTRHCNAFGHIHGLFVAKVVK